MRTVVWLALEDPGAEYVAYITPPSLTVAPDGQRYTWLGPNRWRFDSLGSGFTAELTVDEDGLVIDYATLFRRAGSWEPDH